MPDRWRPAADWSPGPDDVIDVWRLDLMVREEDWTLLSTDETQRARRILVDNKRDQKVSARAHLRRILARYGNTAVPISSAALAKKTWASSPN